MRKLLLPLLIVVLSIAPVAAQSEIEKRVLLNVRAMMAESGGRVTFSDLHNSPDFSSEEKAFLGRLFEIFFAIPGVIKSEYESTGVLPTRKSLGDSFGISASSVDLLLAVMKSDPRVPPLFDLDAKTREIESINLANIDAFVKRRSSQVRVTQWEGKKLPPFSVVGFDGAAISGSDLGGTNTLVYFWFTGCPPCGRISPHLAELDRKYGGSKFRILGINADKLLGIGATDQRRASYLKKLGVKFDNAHANEAILKAFGGINIYPTLFFAEPSGTIVRHFINYQDMETLESVVQGMVAK